MANDAGPPPEQVREWIEAADREVAELSEEVEKGQTRLAQARRRLVLYHEILATVTKTPIAISDEVLKLSRSVRDRTIEAAVEILQDHGKPLRIQDIHAEFIRRGKPLPGRGTPTNIVAHLTNAPAIERRARGVYALTKWTAPPSREGQQDEPADTPAAQESK